jgi:hypothetical protein
MTKLIGSILAGILILFGVLLVLGSTSSSGQGGWLIFGLLVIGIGLVIVFFVFRKPVIKPGEPGSTVTYKVDLPANVSMDSMKCRSCGGSLTPDNVSMVAGAPVVTCPYCKTTYQLTEDPKW